MSHLKIAATQSMKAGLNAYMVYLQRSGLPTVQAKLDAYQALPKRKRLAAYCNEFGARVTAEKASMRQPRAVVPAPQNEACGVIVEAEGPLADEIAQARAVLARLEAQAAQTIEQPKQDTVRKPNVWHPWAVRKHNIPTKVGAEFTYKGKRRTSTFKVTKVMRDGSVESIRVK